MTKPLRFGLVGIGQQGERIAAAFDALPGGALAGVASMDANRAAAFATRWKVPLFFDSLPALLARPDIDATIIASPNHRHAHEARSALGAGKHVLLEKPMALTADDAASLVRAAAGANRLLGLMFQFRHQPAISEARRRIRNGDIGEVMSLDMEWSVGHPGGALPELPEHQAWREDPARAGGGAIVARGVHLVDLARFLTDRDLKVIAGETEPHPTVGVDRIARALVRAGSTLVHLATSKVSPFARNEICISGSRGSMTLRDVFTSGATQTLTCTTREGAAVQTFEAGNPLAARLLDFMLAVSGGAAIGASGEDGLAVARATDDFLTAASGERRITA